MARIVKKGFNAILRDVKKRYGLKGETPRDHFVKEIAQLRFDSPDNDKPEAVVLNVYVIRADENGFIAILEDKGWEANIGWLKPIRKGYWGGVKSDFGMEDPDEMNQKLIDALPYCRLSLKLHKPPFWVINQLENE